MTLKEFRKLFVDITGRFDLVQDEESYADNGANFYIQAGQRFLDKSFKHSKSFGEQVVQLKRGLETYSLDNYLSVTNVQVSTPDSGWVTLGLRQDDEINEVKPSGSNALGLPRFYSVVNLMRSPLVERSETAIMKLGIRLFPVPDTELEAKISGRYTTPLTKDSDTSFWLVAYPETLIRAAQYQIESFHRNTQGANDHLMAIQRDMLELEHDEIESEIGQISQMRDSFNFRGKGNAR